MDQKRKIWIGTAIAAVAILYFTGTLWPLVRFTLTLIGVASLAASTYFGFWYFRASHAANSDSSLEKPKAGQAIAAVTATVLTFFLLTLVPSASSDMRPEVEPEATSGKSVVDSAARTTQTKPAVSSIIEKTKKQPEQSHNTTKPLVNSPPPPVSKSNVLRSPEKTSTATVSRPRQAASKPKMSPDEADRAAAEFMGALLGAAMEQERREKNDPRYQRLKQSIEQACVCSRCGGAGNYRFVDGNGVLQVRACPGCRGSGKAF
ncbi:membrane protein [Rhodopirellula sp. SWK7]|uniref:membrane protein n=1 Tax=Rhodopirellula sp. SWK7 TaxID=595460 RepID=UPI0002BD3F22|nr:membrane protein [Rhodopirellula sp. SWK7]EMI44893.1 membrane protein [Rhodopirellula sp. SWK7]